MLKVLLSPPPANKGGLNCQLVVRASKQASKQQASKEADQVGNIGESGATVAHRCSNGITVGFEGLQGRMGLVGVVWGGVRDAGRLSYQSGSRAR